MSYFWTEQEKYIVSLTPLTNVGSAAWDWPVAGIVFHSYKVLFLILSTEGTDHFVVFKSDPKSSLKQQWYILFFHIHQGDKIKQYKSNPALNVLGFLKIYRQTPNLDPVVL